MTIGAIHQCCGSHKLISHNPAPCSLHRFPCVYLISPREWLLVVTSTRIAARSHTHLTPLACTKMQSLIPGFASAGFVSSSDPAATLDGDTPGLGSTMGLGSAGLGATPSQSSDWDTPGLGSTMGLGATPGPSETPSNGGLGFVSASSGPKKVPPCLCWFF